MVAFNGATAIQGQTVEDIVAEFSAELGVAANDLRYDLEDIVTQLRDAVEEKIGDSVRPDLQLVVGGYSRGRRGTRYGEGYTLTGPEGEATSHFTGDANFGAVYGGQSEPIYRFLMGYDRLLVMNLINPWGGLYCQTWDYVIDRLLAEGVEIPEDVREIPLPPVRLVNPWTLLSTYDFADAPANVTDTTAGANVPDAQLLDATIRAIVLERPPVGAGYEQHLALDKGYDNDTGYGAYLDHEYVPHIAPKRDARPPRKKRHKARRWVVERTLAWQSMCRGILVRWEKKSENDLGMLKLAWGLIWFRRYHQLANSLLVRARSARSHHRTRQERLDGFNLL